MNEKGESGRFASTARLLKGRFPGKTPAQQ
jgi:hypothetical protein